MRKRIKKLFGLSLVAVFALAIAYQPSKASAQRHDRDHDDNDYQGEMQEREEIRQSYELSPGATVEVQGINGTVDIETTNGQTAEVHIIRFAATKEDLNYHKILIEHSGNRLVVRGENERDRNQRNRRVRHRVTMKIPRRVDLTTGGVNGRVNIGEVDGPVKVSGVNGKVSVGQAVGYTELSGINGSVTITIAQLSTRGIDASGINGRVELRFTEDINADLDVTGINGSVQADMPNVTVFGKISRDNFRAKIGSGGTPIQVSGINGGVRLARATGAN
ncbi:MAG TPA: hypothetical protein VKA70_01050 [Blastocatellia bacterium]|nr:hypothetical protein [Blastocatellia bacterium]